MIDATQLNPLQAAGAQAQRRELSYLDKIIEKKVNNIALSCFETIVHWFLTTFSCFYPAYDRLFQDQILRTKHFPDGTVLRDLTAGKIASVITEKRTNLLQHLVGQMQGGQPAPTVDINFIALNGRKVLFTAVEHVETLFGREFNTDNIIISDLEGHLGQVTITEYETTGDVKQGIVDTGKTYLKSQRIGLLPLEIPEKVYLTEEAIGQIQDGDLGYLRPEE